VRIFAGDTLKNRMVFFGMQEDEIIESRMVSKTIENAQERVEKHNFDGRKHLLEYDDVLNQQRIVVYKYRLNALEGEQNIYNLIRDFIAALVEDLIAYNAPQRHLTPEQIQKVYEGIIYITGLKEEDIQQAGISTATTETLTNDLINLLLKQYALYRKQHNDKIIQSAEKWLVLETIDQAWKQQMLNLDHLKEGIGLRGWGQKTPLIEYKREAFEMFKEMITQIHFDIVHHIFHLNTTHFDSRHFEERREQEMDEINLSSNSQ